MDSSKQLMVVGSVVVIMAAITGIFVTQRSLAMPRQAEVVAAPSAEKSDEWKGRLTAEQYHVTREKGTERPFTGKYWNYKGHGVYRCVCCKAPLFDSSTKFDSGTGWPSFYQPIEDAKIDENADISFVTERTEVVCGKCKAHLGHRFEDAPQQPTGLRYCINSAALDFQETPSKTKTGLP